MNQQHGFVTQIGLRWCFPLSPDEFSLWPPVGEITENTEDDWQSNTRPIDFIDSPRCHLSPVKFKHALCKVYADHGDF
jgi:hypothetical protein